MSLMKRLFGGGTNVPKDLTAREGYDLAVENLKEAHANEADKAYLCLLYTSAADADVIVEQDGKCQGWHFDFFLPDSRQLYLVRIQNGKIRTKELEWEQTKNKYVEYVYAYYGLGADKAVLADPPRAPKIWLDSPAIAASIHKAMERYRNPNGRYEIAIQALCLPAERLRYAQDEKAQQQLGFPPASPDCFGIICTTEELYDEDSYLLYINAATGKVEQKHIFRFPNLFYFGSSFNW